VLRKPADLVRFPFGAGKFYKFFVS